jgi:hypothetical protein
MYRRIKRILIYFISILVVLVGLVTALTFIFKNDITSFFLNELNKRLQTEIKVKNVDFSVLRKFPYASIEFNEISSKASPNYGKSGVDVSADTLFKFKSLFLEFSIYDLLTKNFKISKVHALKGYLNIARDRSGNLNYLIWKTSSNTDTSNFKIKLQNVKLTDVSISYFDFKAPKQLSAFISNCQIRCNLSSLINEFSSRFDGRIINFQFENQKIITNKDVNCSVNLKLTNDALKLENTSLTIARNNFNIDGIYNSKHSSETKFNIICKKINIENTLLLLPQKMRMPFENYNIKGNLSINASLNFSKLNVPLIDLNFSPVQSSISFEYNKIRLSELDFAGNFYSQLSDSMGITNIKINNIKGKIDADHFEGSVSILKSGTSTFEIKWKGNSTLNTLNKLIHNDTLKYFTGNFNGNLEIKGDLRNHDSLTKYNFAHFDYTGEINLDGIRILKPEVLLGISDVSGKFKIDKDILVEKSNIIYKENNLTGSGRITNFLPWLLTENETLAIQGDIQSQSFNLDKVIAKSTASKNDTSVTQFPDKLLLTLEVKFNEFYSGKFKAVNVAGKITYKPKLFDLRSLYFETMEGNLTGSAILLQKPDNHFIFRTQALLDKINISTLFSTFNNFGQTLIDYKNIKGKISGLTNFSSEWSNSFSVLSPSILVDGTYKIENGELIEYEPLNGLSKYINVEELKHIYFSTLQNDIFIRNRVITIPQMDIKSANFDIVGSGIHDFDNNFTYKIKVLLSESLYKKAKKSKDQMDEFGVLETEGTRKISLPLTIKGNINDYKVSYDAKQAAVNMIQNLKNEKKQLKALLNQEFGLFKKDSINKLKQEPKKKNNILIEFDNENYQSGKKTDQVIKPQSIRQKDAKNNKDTSKIKIDFQ